MCFEIPARVCIGALFNESSVFESSVDKQVLNYMCLLFIYMCLGVSNTSCSNATEIIIHPCGVLLKTKEGSDFGRFPQGILETDSVPSETAHLQLLTETGAEKLSIRKLLLVSQAAIETLIICNQFPHLVPWSSCVQDGKG